MLVQSQKTGSICAPPGERAMLRLPLTSQSAGLSLGFQPPHVKTSKLRPCLAPLQENQNRSEIACGFSKKPARWHGQTVRFCYRNISRQLFAAVSVSGFSFFRGLQALHENRAYGIRQRRRYAPRAQRKNEHGRTSHRASAARFDP